MRHFLITCILLLSCSMGTWAQNIVVTGVVTDAQKEPLIGVNVAVKDVPGLGAITDINGKYKISIEPYQRLIFSYVGFDKVEVLIKEQRVVNVSMKESAASSLDEVVITGTGVQKKLTVTGAITTVNVSDLTHTANGNVVNALAGNVAGVLAMQTSGQPGRNTSEFWIRGISTFGASTSALVLVDGFERDLDDVNIEDIESFSVLKDASATAIYGSRGANGVVLITTKHGKAGKINIDAKVETSYNTRTITPKFVDGYTYATMMNEARITRNQEPIYQQDELDLLRMGLDPDLYPNVDWTDLLLKDGAMTYRANVNMNGGGSTARYFVSLSYLKEDGMYKTDETLRKDYNTNANANTWNYRLNTDIDITKTTLLKVGVSGSLKKYNEPGLSGDVWKSLMYQNPISVPVMYSNGYVPAYGTGDRTNPWVLATQTGYKEHWENTIQSNLTLEQKLDFITQGLKFVGRFGFDTWNKNNIDRIKWPEQYKAQRFRDENGNLVFDRVTEEQKMKQTSSAEGNRNEIFEAELHYDRGFKEHHVGGLLKFNQDSKVFTVGTGEDIKKGIARRHLGLAGRVSYNWNYRYFVDFNFGYNGSENFADGHRFGFFPAVSAAWNVAEEPIIKKNLKWMNMFKIRYSFGKVGNDVLKIGDDEYRFPYLYTIGDGSGYTWADYNYNNSYSGKRYTDLASNYATWEIATKHDLGVDLALFNDKFTATVDYFHEQREGIWMERKYLPSIVGLGSNPRANVGKVLSEGFDGNFAFREKINKVDITVRGNITYSQNTILEKDEENNVYPYQMERDYRVNQAKGLIALGLFKDYDDIRNSPKQEFGTVQPGDIKYKDVNGDGVVNDGDKVAIGATTKPNMIYGFGISASWKGLDVNVHFQGAGKTSFFIEGATVHTFSAGEWGNILSDVANSNRWIDHEISGTMATENPNASYPRLSYGGNSNNYRQSTFWLRNGSYLRLKTLELGYSIPKPLVNKIRFNNIRLFLRGSNLLTFSSFKLWDPELGSSTGTEYPLAKSLTLGLSVNL
ncbi:SusC/RagA family TonB-linked outer membrane protein [Bacteroides thetaiotaomicron]|uniref:TonB-dependent receptor n=1 Tax=Bacteroides thetaiotaomicron TaxID=818 RepID=A0AAW4ZMG3_BACT4|nr:TonB-dependent receptor [Bacteroides thetaiotaomicron]MCE9241103.1 TonB-dependent receptor [Bacteroides thetaiotaomicron]MCE9269589.1 TonB-dependent receptor [Bacteroides thetaiotaomicron]MCE9279557.1 TonB-dependent receptor [Bacteroides thetaiotaomicron]MCE9294286.1 TonB-dependent receptor [Bacteroides thetaiotaomicron]